MAHFNQERIREIGTQTDPLAIELYDYSKKIKNESWMYAIAVIIVGIASSIIMINASVFQGVAIGLMVGSAILGMVIGSIGELVSIVLKAKANQLNNTYRTEKLIEFWMLENTKAEPEFNSNNDD